MGGYFRAFIIALALAAYAPAAEAVRVKNMDQEAHTFTIDNAGEQHRITLGQYDLINFFGPVVTVTMESGQTVQGRNLDEYIIDHGQLIIQRRRDVSNGRR